MTAYQKIENYFNKESTFNLGINQLRSLLESTELKEEWKWSFPTYTLKGENVVSISNFKNHFGIWFFQGALLEDSRNLLHNNQEGKTQAMRCLKYTSNDELDARVVTAYLLEAIDNCKKGKKITFTKSSATFTIPTELNEVFTHNPALKNSYFSLTLGRQKEYAVHIDGAKRPETRIRRLKKCIPMIQSGTGLNDKDKK